MCALGYVCLVLVQGKDLSLLTTNSLTHSQTFSGTGSESSSFIIVSRKICLYFARRRMTSRGGRGGGGGYSVREMHSERGGVGWGGVGWEAYGVGSRVSRV